VGTRRSRRNGEKTYGGETRESHHMDTGVG
jgi:hypothetical protein